MTKLSRIHLEPEDLDHYINNLWSAFTLASSKEDIRLLFKDLLTHTEYKMLAKRFEIARRLLDRQTYDDIKHDLHVTDPTISKVSNSLSIKGDGFRKAHGNLTRLEDKILEKQKQYTDNLADPFKRKMRRKTVMGTLALAGIKVLDKKITKVLRNKSAEKYLDV